MEKLATQYFDVPGARIAYTCSGSGPALLLLHGNSSSKAEFSRYQREYFPDFYTLAVDSRGHGQTISSAADFNFDRYSDDVLALCAGLGISEANVIGYSDGGNLSLHLAKKAPRLFKRIIAISPNVEAAGLNEKFLNGTRSAVKIASFLGRLGFPTKRFVMRLELMTNDIGLSEADLQGLQANIKILYAEHDLIKEEHILKIAGLIPHCGLQKIMDCNHLTIFNKKETLASIRDYFAA